MAVLDNNQSAVLLSKPEFLEWPALGKAIAAFRKIPPLDAAHEARLSWGIVGQRLTEPDAAGLVSNLEQAGLGGVVVPQSQLQTARAPHLIHHIELHEEGLKIEVNPGDTRAIPWPFFSVVAVSALKRTAVKTIQVQTGPSAAEKFTKMGILLTTGIPLPMKRKQTVVKKIEESELFFFLDLFLKQNGLRIRLDPQSLDFSFFGDQMGMGTYENFRHLVAEVGKKTGGALQNRGARVLLKNLPVNTMGYETANDLEKECGWLLTLSLR